jgi:hypothetical protein
MRARRRETGPIFEGFGIGRTVLGPLFDSRPLYPYNVPSLPGPYGEVLEWPNRAAC